MKRQTNKSLRSALSFVLAVTILLGTAPMSFAENNRYISNGVDRFDSSLRVDMKDYINSEVMFQLPTGVGKEDDVSVIIKIGEPSLMDAYDGTDQVMSFREYATTDEAAAITAKIATRKAEILSLLDEQGVAYTTGEDYTALFSGFELVIKAGDYAVTCMSLGAGEKAVLSEAYRPAETQLVENDVNVYETGIFNSSDVAYDGSGMVVAVLDTGLDSNHTAFSTSNFTSEKLGLTYQDVAALVGKTKANELSDGLTVDDVYINDKVPFGYDYADKDPDVYSTHNNHGTHVSGVIVGKDDTITGVAPNAQLVAMKIFSDVQDSALSSWILAALEDCVVLGVDVINMSLGTACGFGHESEEELLDGVYDRIRKAGIAVVVAASNSYNSAYGSEANGNLPLTSNPDSGTVGSPGTYEGVLSVGSVNGVETPYIKFDKTIMYFDEANDNSGKEKNFFDTLLGEEDSIKAQYVTIPGVGRSADYTGLDVKGKIALVRRGSNTFEEKALIAEAQGAIGIIIYNNVSGEIKMNIGDATLAVCSISQDDGEVLAARDSGTLVIARDQTSGPFMSDFSSWGPTPSLGIKPEITAHGGNILSSVTGGGYDRLSGTSMACPNLAGVTVLLHQYVVENFPDIADDAGAVTAMVNRLMMSTADIIINTNGEPYAVRKQGAGLANLATSTQTPACIITYNKDGEVMDTSKLELGDDPDKTGVYQLVFTVDNFGDKTVSYDLGAHVITEGVSDTKTNAGKTTVTEQAYVLEGAKVKIESVEGGSAHGNKITVGAGEEAKITVTITLSDEDKAYLNESFENGMYVEGFITLEATRGTKIDLSVPYLAYYGDWTQAPMFDLEYYETNADELDDGIDPEDKLMADAYATRAVGGISSDFVSYLGSYYFMQDPEDIAISANRDYIALSNQEGTVHSLRFVWAGMLRAARKVEISIIDDTTGEVVFECVDDDVRKSYGDGGTIRPSNIEVEFDTQDYNLANNSRYTVRLVGHMDYAEGGLDTNKNNVIEFPLVADFEAPTVNDVEFYYEYDKTEKKNKLYAKIAVYDNHYTMCMQPGYVIMSTDADGNETPEMLAFEQFMTPVYSKENSTTYVTLEMTDYLYQIKDKAMNKNSFVVTCYDYALNYASYEIRLPDEYTEFYFDGLEEGLVLSPNEVYSLEPVVTPDSQWAELLEFSSSKPSVVRVVNNKLVAVKSGTAVIRVDDPRSDKRLTFPVKVLKKGEDGYRKYDRPVADMFILTGYTTDKAYYMLDNEDKDIGDTGNIRFFEGRYSLSMYPSEAVTLNYDLDAYFPQDTKVVFESSNESIVKVSDTGKITAVAEGFSSVTVKILQDGKSTYYSESVSVEVKDPYDAVGGILNHYYGLGGLVEVPVRLKLKEIGSFAFSNFEYIDKTPEELEIDDRETVKQWYIGDGTITKVVLPEGVEKINAYAFANLTALEEIVLPSTLTAIEYGAFYGCTSLKKITFSGENNVIIINQHAFEKCDLEGTLEMPAACVISDYAFAGNKDLKKVITGDSLLSIGQYAFAGCESLKDIKITAELVKYGAYAFTGCEKLTEFYVNAAVLPEGMFYECEKLTTVTIGPDVNDIGSFAFRTTAVDTFVVEKGNKAYQAGKASYILSKDKKTLVAVASTAAGEFGAAQMDGAEVTEIAKGAFSHTVKVTAVNLPKVTKLGAYAFGSSTLVETVTLGELKEIGEYAFFETSLKELPAFTAKTEIGRYAFAFTAITEVTIPDKMEVAEGVFSECKQLTTVVVGNKVKLGKYAFGMDKDSAFTVEHMDQDGKRYFYYTFGTALTSVTIGEEVEIGETAFTNAASLETVTLGVGAKLGKMAFYNNASLVNIDLSAVTEIGDYALSGDVYYMCLDDQMSVAAVDSTGHYMYTYHSPRIPMADLSAAKEIGEYAFAYCRDMIEVKLGEKIDEIKPYTFAGCSGLTTINLSAIKMVGEYAFTECGALLTADLTAAKEIGDYAFVYGKALQSVTLNPKGCTIGEGAFSYCEVLDTVTNMNAVTVIGDYAFAYTALTEAVLTDAEELGDHAFMKETYVPFTVTLGEELEKVGDNPFAMCVLKPFSRVEETGKGDKKKQETVFTYDLGKKVKIIDGSLYCTTASGMELITYLGTDPLGATVAEDTTRISAMAFAGSNVKLVTLPATLAAIGHKAFFDCDELEMVVFRSFRAPSLEEAFDPAYYETFTHIPGTGDYGTYTDYDGNEVPITGTSMLPYYMWNATGGLYCNVFYGANFKDYVGYVTDKVAMIRPENGIHYDSYIYSQYFDTVLGGTIAADETAMAAIMAIRSIPKKVTLDDAAIVAAARVAYNKVATTLQQGLVSNYADLITAEQRLAALESAQNETPEEESPVEELPRNRGWIVWVCVVAVLLLAVAAGMWFGIKKKGSFTALVKSLPATAKTASKVLWAVLKKAAAWIGAVCVIAFVAVKALVGKLRKKKIVSAEEATEEAEGSEPVAPTEEAVLEPIALEVSEKPVLTETVAEPAVEAPAEQEPVAEEKPKKVKKARKVKKPRKAKKHRARKYMDPEQKRRLTNALLIVAAVVLVAVLALAVIRFVDWDGGNNPYDTNDREQYTVSVRYDANGGTFTTNTAVIVDSFNIAEMQTGTDGKVSIALLAPDASARGNDAFTATRTDSVLVGWYAQRTENGKDAEGNPVYTYAQPWDFDKDQLAVAADGTYSASEPVLTLYAAWAPRFEVQFYDRANPDTLIGTYVCKDAGGAMNVPAWDETTGAMEMYDFPVRKGYTFDKAYLDAAGTQPVTDKTLAHTGSVNRENGTVEGAIMKVYTDWIEGEWYHIYTAEQFADNASVSGSYVLHADLDFSEENWPTALMYGQFGGTIVGNGHTIRNVTLTQTNNSKANAGLFGALTDTAKIQDLTFENVIFTIKAGTRVAGSAYGLLTGSLAAQAELTGLSVVDSHLQIDGDAYFGTDDYVIGLLCGMGYVDSLDLSGVDCTVVGKEPYGLTATINGNTVTVEIVE